MKTFLSTLRAGLLISLLLAGSALAADKVNINTADVAALDEALVNIGPAKAEAIVSYRKANGPFRSVEQLAQVPGIGLKTVEKNRDRIVIGNAPAAAPAAQQKGGAAAPRPAAH